MAVHPEDGSHTFAVTTGNRQSSMQINAESQSKIALPTILLWELQLV